MKKIIALLCFLLLSVAAACNHDGVPTQITTAPTPFPEEPRVGYHLRIPKPIRPEPSAPNNELGNGTTASPKPDVKKK